MSVVNEILDLLLDTKHIADHRSSKGASRLRVWRAYMRLRLLRLQRRAAGGSVSIMGYRLRYFDVANLAQLFQEIFIKRFYDWPLDTDRPTIIDCGSNIGMSIVFFNDLYPQAQIVGFEPNPITFAALRENIERNGWHNVVLHQVALGDQRGNIDFFVNEKEPGALNVGLYAARDAKAISVPADRLSSFIDREVDLLKIDIEGAEDMVFEDLARHDKLRYIRNIICEYHHHHRRDDTNDRLSVPLSILERAGFGYQLDSYYGRSRRPSGYQDVLIYAYRKGDSAN